MPAKEHLTDAYRAINPSGKVPALIIESKGEELNKPRNKIILTQSTAILEFLEEVFPTTSPLLPAPGAFVQRARVREMVGIITQDIFPRVNRSTAQRVHDIRGSEDDRREFVHSAINDGFDAYESLLSSYGGKFSVGDEITLADVCLAPQVFQARNWGVDVRGSQTKWPRIKELVMRLDGIEAFRKETMI